MHKRIVVIGMIVSVCILFVTINLINNNKNIEPKDLYTSDTDVEKELVNLDDIRNSVDDVKNDIKSGAYSNLSGEDVSVYIADGNKICSKVSEYLKWESYEGITDPKEMLEYELSLIQFFLGTDLNPKYLIDASSLNEDFDFDYNNASQITEELEEYPFNNYEKVCKMMEEGTYESQYGDGMPRLGYSNGFNVLDESDEYRYAYYISCSFDVEKGKLKEMLDSEVVLKYCTSYINTDENLEDKYILTDGSEVSIKECFDTAVKYLEQIPYKGREGIEFVPIRADVYSLSYSDVNNEYHNKYFIDVIFTREYDGMYIDFGEDYGHYIGYNLDCARFTIIEKNEVEEVIDYTNRAYLENIDEEADKIISLDNALEILNNSVGNNSKYKVLNIGLVYRRKHLIYNDGIIYEKYELTPKWRIDCISEINDEKRTFYIDVFSGKVEYVRGLFTPLRDCELQ